MCKNKICVYAICKNESKNIDRWAKSMLEADCVVVLDTGSEDDSVEKLRSHGIHVEQKIINPFRFDTARNESLKLVPDDCNILVCTDLDEYFEAGWANILREFWDDEKYTQVSYYKYGMLKGVDGYYNEIHGKGFKWKYPVHECLYCENDKRKILDLTDKIFLHHEQDETKSRKLYFDLIKLRKEENEDDYIAVVFYISECLYYGYYEETIKEAKKIIANENFNDKYSVWYVHKCLANAYHEIGDFENAEKTYIKTIELDDENITGYLEYAQFIDNVKNDLGKSISILKEGLRKSKYKLLWTYVKNDYNKIYDMLSISSFYNGEKLKSLGYAYKAYTLNKDDKRLKSNLDAIVNNMTFKDFLT